MEKPQLEDEHSFHAEYGVHQRNQHLGFRLFVDLGKTQRLYPCCK